MRPSPLQISFIIIGRRHLHMHIDKTAIMLHVESIFDVIRNSFLTLYVNCASQMTCLYTGKKECRSLMKLFTNRSMTVNNTIYAFIQYLGFLLFAHR